MKKSTFFKPEKIAKSLNFAAQLGVLVGVNYYLTSLKTKKKPQLKNNENNQANTNNAPETLIEKYKIR